MSKKLAAAAEAALTGKGFESKPGWCLRWVRQVVQKTYGHQYDEYFTDSAYHTMLAFKKSPYAVKPENGSVPGDILFKGLRSGRFGHVGIRLAGNKVAENSSAHTSDTDREARGTRSINNFGTVDLIVRLPD